MSFLTPPTPRTLTLAEKQQQAAERIRRTSAANFEILQRMQREGISMVWRNTSGLTPQQVCDGLGTDAGKAFDMHGRLTEFILGIAAVEGVQPKISLPTFAFTRNPDGTVTVDPNTPYTPGAQQP